MKHFIISGPGFVNECICYPSDKLIDNLGTIGNIIWVMSPLVGLIVLLISKKNYMPKAFITFGILLFVVPLSLSFVGDSIRDYEVKNNLGHICECEKSKE